MGHGRQGMADAPRQLFSTTPAERTAIARRQFFEEGQRPSGLVSEAVIQSWMRCHRMHRETRGLVSFDPVTPSRLHATQERSRGLMQAAQGELSAMAHALAGADVRVLLTDGEGVILYLSPVPTSVPQLPSRHAGRLGSNISERASGTTAPGIVAATGQACTVSGGEHYFDDLHLLQCAAAPIRDVTGRTVGVLDLTALARPFDFDAGRMVAMHAATIENALLQAQSREHLILRFQISPDLLDTPLQGLAGIAADGTVAWLNDAGARLVGRWPRADGPHDVESLFGHDLPSLLHLSRRPDAQCLPLANGLRAWTQARVQAPDGLEPRLASNWLPAPPADGEPSASVQTANTPPAEPAPAAAPHVTLRDHNRKLIEETLAAHEGNVSQAARQLRISRGTLYRRMREWNLLASPEAGGSGR
ncbi:helix-turn-helix domain-containing protein [Ottowia sp.]|uniref:helix-turn-helix domain-containing protein n=1 Tax=Ottowia sp. TaxID=1898956 RepID=UPI0039E45D83